MKIADLPDFDPAEYLKTKEDIAAYLKRMTHHYLHLLLVISLNQEV